MLLQMDDDDDEAEEKIRRDIEAEAERRLAAELAAQQRNVVSAARGGATANEIVAARGSATQALQAALLQGADLGVAVAFRQLQNVGMAFDYTLANEQARDWAAQYNYNLVSQIDNTSERALRQAVGNWIEQGGTLRDLQRDLEPIFGRQRARLIAQTETTRAFFEGNRAGWRQSGVIDQLEWRTSNDERVCPVCGNLHGTRAPLNGDFGGYLPPAHPGCRCWAVGVVE